MAKFEPRLIAITDFERFGPETTIEAFSRLCDAAKPNSICVQLRCSLPAREQLVVGQRLLEVVSKSHQVLAVNERMDVALALAAGGIHLKGTSVPASVARRLWSARGRTAWVTRAWHPGDEVQAALDALVVSPVFAPRKGRPALGVRELGRLVGGLAPHPVYALGGVGPEEAALAVSTGAQGVAAITACYVQGSALLEKLAILR